MPSLTVHGGSLGATQQVTVAGGATTLGEVKALAGLPADCALFVLGFPYRDSDVTLDAAKWDGAAPIYAGQARITLAAAAQHASKTDLWLVLHAPSVFGAAAGGAASSGWGVYDLTAYSSEHPGGLGVMLAVAGKDATSDYVSVGHSAAAKRILMKFPVGALCPTCAAVLDKELAAKAKGGCSVA